MSLFGVSIFAGRIITGLMLDRFWAPLVTLPILCLPAMSCLLLAGDRLTFTMAIFAAFLLGFSSGAETDLIAFLAGRYFGMANYGRIYGSLYMVFGICVGVLAARLWLGARLDRQLRPDLVRGRRDVRARRAPAADARPVSAAAFGHVSAPPAIGPSGRARAR